MDRIEIASDNTFDVGGEHFVIDVGREGRRRSDDDAFTVVKSEPYIRFYESLAGKPPRGLLELGIFQGGGYVLLDKIFRPGRMSAVDISPDPIEALEHYMQRTPGRTAHFGVSQSDEQALRSIVRDDLGGELEMVVDDASHTYEHTRKSFEVLFPLLAPGGLYVIEDWAWAHNPAYQGPDAPLAGRPALSNLLFEQIMLLGSTRLIDEIRVRKPFYVVRKGRMRTPPTLDVWEGVRLRDRAWPAI